jgi:acyl carrier protein
MTETETLGLRQKVLEHIINFSKEIIYDDPDTITEDTTFESQGLDSLDLVELSMSLEDDFEVSFNQEPLAWESPKDAIDSVVRLKS